jgi:hypothetical protein
MFENLKSLATEGKDSLVAMAVKKIVNMKLSSKYPDAHIEELSIDSKDKNITATITIPELDEPFTIQALNYKITEKNDHYFLEVEELVKSQDWGNDYTDGKRYKIPPEVVSVAKVIL